MKGKWSFASDTQEQTNELKQQLKQRDPVQKVLFND